MTQAGNILLYAMTMMKDFQKEQNLFPMREMNIQLDEENGYVQDKELYMKKYDLLIHQK